MQRATRHIDLRQGPLSIDHRGNALRLGRMRCRLRAFLLEQVGAALHCTHALPCPALPCPALPCPALPATRSWRSANGAVYSANRSSTAEAKLSAATQSNARQLKARHCKGTASQQTAALRAFRHRQSDRPALRCALPPPAHCMRRCSWGSCSVSCGDGSAVRTRAVAVRAADGGLPCGATSEAGVCAAAACPVDCVLTAWSAWARCSDRCDGAALHAPHACARAHNARRARRLPAISCRVLLTAGLPPQRVRRCECAWSWRRPRSAGSLAAGAGMGTVMVGYALSSVLREASARA
jgi:hypothetical protein